jgi:Icc-related predicted phosphoesterase
MLRIYAVADIHGRADKLALILEKLDVLQPDALVVAGDIAGRDDSGRIIEQLSNSPAPVLGIRGNTDPPAVDQWLGNYANTVCLHLKQWDLMGIPFVGVSGTFVYPFGSRLAVREAPVLRALEPLVNDTTILVAHPPPWGVLDQALGRFHVGCRSLRTLVQKRRPRLLICGHVHEHPGVDTIGTTRVVNCSVARTGQGGVICLAADRIVEITMLSA